MKFRFAVLLAGLVSVGGECVAAVCVTTADELSAALAAAQAEKTSSHEIRIRSGHYTAPASGWLVDVHQSGTIAILGGFLDADCQTQSLDAALTRLDGNQAVRPLTVATSFDQDLPFGGGQITISGLTFENGSGGNVGGLQISDGGPIYNGSILVERNQFLNNSATFYQEDNSAGALLAATDGPDFSGNVFLKVRGNLFVGNDAPNGAAAQLFSNNSIDVSNNTVTGNQSFDADILIRSAFAVFTLSGINYSNNIFWNNNPDGLENTYDLRAESPFRADLAADLFNNDVQAVHGTPGTDIGNRATDPLFVDPLRDFRLSVASPLINAGLDDPDGGLTSSDLAGSERVQGAHVDIGAFESEILYRNGFD